MKKITFEQFDAFFKALELRTNEYNLEYTCKFLEKYSFLSVRINWCKSLNLHQILEFADEASIPTEQITFNGGEPGITLVVHNIEPSEVGKLLKTFLRQEWVDFCYTKADGTTRQATGTLNLDLIPESAKQFKNEGEKEENNVVKYYDYDKQAWRSCKASSIKTIEPVVRKEE